MNARLDQHVALVTGAGQGVGREVALELARRGAAVAVNDFHLERAQTVTDEITGSGGRGLAVQADVTDLDAVEQMVGRITSDVGTPTILVNNAGNAGPTSGISDRAQFWEADTSTWDKWLATNLFGVMHCTRAVLPGMVERRGGRIVTVISDAARVGEPNLVVYSAAKAGAAGFARAIARAVGRYDITSNCVALGATVTPTTAALGELPPDSDAAKRLLRNYIIRRFGTTTDAAAAIAFLASDEAGWITAQTLPVNGGYSVTL
jgi:2-hydroxycyclohexanecarboxyl-CoA dehydrogenase